MVTFINKGRCGNFLFQAATAIGYAHKHNMDFSVPIKTQNSFWNPLYFPHLANIQFNDRMPRIDIVEKQHPYHEIKFAESFRLFNVFLDGYWQSHLYFNFCRDKVLSLFGLPYAFDPGVVSIHVRRGDYLLYPLINPLVQRTYYIEAIQHFSAKGYNYFKVFSDDIGWCKQEFSRPEYQGVNFFYSQGHSIIDDLVLMSQCEHNIMSNSTYAWWGAWLNQNPQKIVICPHEDNYYGPANKHLDVSTLYPPEWVRIKYAV